MQAHIIHLKKSTTLRPQENTHFILTSSPAKSTSSAVFIDLSTPHLSANITGVFVLRSESFTLKLVATHKAPNTSCLISIKAILLNHANFSFSGKIIIAPQAHQTTASLKENVFLAGQAIVNLSEPTLEINAGDVSASHAATLQGISPAELYYLQTRGLSKIQAKSLLMQGFLESELATITDPIIQSSLRQQLFQKL